MNQGLLSVDAALARLLAEARPVAELEEVPTLEATGRILARAQRSGMDVPPMDNSAMDGFAVRTADGERLRVAQKIMAGAVGKPLLELVEQLFDLPVPLRTERLAIGEGQVPPAQTQLLHVASDLGRALLLGEKGEHIGRRTKLRESPSSRSRAHGQRAATDLEPGVDQRHRH